MYNLFMLAFALWDYCFYYYISNIILMLYLLTDVMSMSQRQLAYSSRVACIILIFVTELSQQHAVAG